MSEDRSEMEAARLAGLQRRHETREARAVRKAVAEEIAAAVVAYKDSPTRRDDLVIQAVANECAAIAREIGSRGPATHWLDLNRVIGIKWGDKVIDPREVVYVLIDPTEGDTA